MNELYERFLTAFRAAGYLTDEHAVHLAGIAVKISNRSRHVTATLKLDASNMQGMIDAVEQGLASVVGKRHAAACVGKVPFEPNTDQVAADYYNALWAAQDTRLHAWQYKGHYLFAHDRAEAACLMSWKLDQEGPVLAMEDFYRVCEAALDVEQDFLGGRAKLRDLLESARTDGEEAMYLCPIPLPAIGARINSSLGPGHVASAEDKDGYRAVVNQLDNGGTELCAHNWSYFPEESVWSDDFGRGEMQKLSRKEWLEQYTQTPRPTREVIIDALLSGTGNFSREYLSTVPDTDLLRIARQGGVEKSLWQSFRRQLDQRPPQTYSAMLATLTGEHLDTLGSRVGVYRRGSDSDATYLKHIQESEGTVWPTTPDGKPLAEDSVNFPCVARPFIVLGEPWKRHDGGPCPVRHEEVLVYTRSQYSAEHQFTKAKPKRCWPESVNWHWGTPGSPTTPIDVLQWRKV